MNGLDIIVKECSNAECAEALSRQPFAVMRQPLYPAVLVLGVS
jgi:hypothetical protein